IAMLCGALSWLSKAIRNGSSAGASSASVEKTRSLAVIVRASGSIDGSAARPLEPDEQAARTTIARAIRANDSRRLMTYSFVEMGLARPGRRRARVAARAAPGARGG